MTKRTSDLLNLLSQEKQNKNEAAKKCKFREKCTQQSNALKYEIVNCYLIPKCIALLYAFLLLLIN